MKANSHDTNYWFKKEQDIPKSFVDLSDYGFIIERKLFQDGLSTEARCLARPALAEALVRARSLLPQDWNFKIYDSYRSWEEQEIISSQFRANYQASYPEMPEHELDHVIATMAPLQRLIMRLDKHRYGGAVDLGLINQHGNDVDVGASVGDEDLDKCRLLYYELRDISEQEQDLQAARRHLITAMEQSGFDPYLPEWWHWGYNGDVDQVRSDQLM